MIIPLIIAVAMFMETLDSTIVSIAIPTIAGAFGINPVDLKLALTSYLITLAIFIPISGYVADRFGSKKTFCLAISVFSFGSLLCALSINLHMLILCRVVQGIGGALMLPVGRLILLRTYPKAEFARVMSIVIVPALLGPALGPTAGGLLLHYATWHAIFWINVPVGILGLLAALYYFPKDAAERQTKAMDIKGFILFGAGLSSLTFAMAVLGEAFAHYDWAIVWFVISLIMLGGYYFHYRCCMHPVLDLALFKNRIFSISMVVGFFSRCTSGAVIFLLPLLLQLIWHDTPLESGFMFFPYALGMMSAKLLFVRYWLKRYGFRRVLWWNCIALALSIFCLAQWSTPGSHIGFGFFLFIQGLLVSQQFTALGPLTYLNIDEVKYSQATSIASTHLQFSVGAGIAFAAILLHFLANYFNLPLFSEKVFYTAIIVLGIIMLLALPFIRGISKEFLLPSAENTTGARKH